MVRALALTSGASGTFYNASHGGFAAVDAAGSAVVDPRPFTDATKPTDIVWVDDDPEGAGGHAERDRWNWVTENPAPFSGARAAPANPARNCRAAACGRD